MATKKKKSSKRAERDTMSERALWPVPSRSVSPPKPKAAEVEETKKASKITKLAGLYSPVERKAVVEWLRKRARHEEHLATKPKVQVVGLSLAASEMMKRAGHLMNAAVSLSLASSIECGEHLPKDVWEIDPTNPEMVRHMQRV